MYLLKRIIIICVHTSSRVLDEIESVNIVVSDRVAVISVVTD